MRAKTMHLPDQMQPHIEIIHQHQIRLASAHFTEDCGYEDHPLNIHLPREPAKSSKTSDVGGAR